ncbi:hypothetical protein Tco_0530756 [Tanacetum coccineum]
MCRWGGWGLGEGAEWRRRGRNGVRETEGMERAGGGWAGDEKGRWVTCAYRWRQAGAAGAVMSLKDCVDSRDQGVDADRVGRCYGGEPGMIEEFGGTGRKHRDASGARAGLQHTVAEADDGVGKGEASRGRRESSEAGSVGRRVGEVARSEGRLQAGVCEGIGERGRSRGLPGRVVVWMGVLTGGERRGKEWTWMRVARELGDAVEGRNAERQNRNQAFNAGNVNDESNQIVERVPRTESNSEKANMKPKAMSTLKRMISLLNNSFGDETLEELTAAVIMMAQIQPADGNSVTEPTYDAKAASEVNASHKVNHVKRKTSIQASDNDEIDSNIIFDDPYVENNGATSEHDSNDHDEYHNI